jgi:hypothetical protein
MLKSLTAQKTLENLTARRNFPNQANNGLSSGVQTAYQTT